MGTETIPKTEEAVPAESPSPIETEIIRQIEYYFGNYNLCRDKFLREQLKIDDGWVPLETMIKFNRLKKLSEDFSVIAEALKKSPKQLMEVNDDCTKIRRRIAQPIPDDYKTRQEELDKKTLYVKGFKKNNTLDELLDYFRSHNVEHVFMRKNMQQNDKPFKGSVFATFESEDDAKKFLETKGLKFGGVELLKEWKTDYVQRKNEQYKNFQEEKAKKLANKAAAVDKKNDKAELEMIPGCLLKLTGFESSNILRENIKEYFEPYGTVVFIDYSRGKPLAVVRFESGIAKSVFEKLPEKDGSRKVEICSSEVEATVIEGEEESEYWKNIAVSRAESRLKFNKGHRGQHRGNKGRFKKWGNKRKGNDDIEDETTERPQKKIKGEKSEENENDSSKMENNSVTVKVESEANA